MCRALRANSFLKDLDLSHLAVDDKAANCIAQVRPPSLVLARARPWYLPPSSGSVHEFIAFVLL
jgi:hypothetical protein